MGRVSSYLNFAGQTEEAMSYYAQVFNAEAPRFMRFGDMPPMDGSPELPAEAKDKVMNTEITILEGYVIRASDALDTFGQNLNVGNNTYICLDPETREEADRLYAALSEGGEASMPLEEQFWGGYFGECVDKFGVQWMFNCTAK